MQTFLPYANFYKSAQCLDYKRLGKQRVEAWQILQTLTGQSKGWANHPAVKMWKGYEKVLTIYGVIVCEEWKSRGYKDTLLNRFYALDTTNFLIPKWLGDESFHASHRSKLLRKSPGYYGQFGWTESPDLPYVWPV